MIVDVIKKANEYKHILQLTLEQFNILLERDLDDEDQYVLLSLMQDFPFQLRNIIKEE